MIVFFSRLVSPSVESTCDQEVYNNITYFVSPKFPALMPSDKEHCSIKIKLVSDDISQIRLDFLHFSLVRLKRISLINGHLIRSSHLRQTRLFFNFIHLHYLQSQPNRMTGACESDVFSIEGGIIPFVLCGQNSGQHSKFSNNKYLTTTAHHCDVSFFYFPFPLFCGVI